MVIYLSPGIESRKGHTTPQGYSKPQTGITTRYALKTKDSHNANFYYHHHVDLLPGTQRDAQLVGLGG
jgi:hypothetical protein